MTHRRLLLSSALGFAITLVLLGLEAHRHNDTLMLLETPGFFTAAAIWGVHSDNYGVLPVALLVNTVVYALIAFAAWTLIHLVRKMFG